MTENKASVAEFNAQRNKLPGDRKRISANGEYVLELYYDPMGYSQSAVIEINKKLTEDGEGKYAKETSVWFYPPHEEEENERQFEDPEAAALSEFKEMENDISKIEQYL